MPSLYCRLKKLVHQGLLSDKDLNKILIIKEGYTSFALSNDSTYGDVIKAIFSDRFESIEDNGGGIYLHYSDGWICIPRDVWEAPYKKETDNASSN